jgi:hypothetical protein
MASLRALRSLVLLAAIPVACSSASSSTATSACRAARGTCVVGPGFRCAVQAPSSAQDCNAAESPAGQVCCLSFDDAGASSAGNEAGAEADGSLVPEAAALDATAAPDSEPGDAAGLDVLALGPPDAYAGLTCMQRTVDADNATFAAESQAAQSCTVDADCVIAWNTSVCWNGCGIVLNKAGAAQLSAFIAQINSTICASFIADGCKPNPPPPCAALLPSCVNHVCGG